MDEKQKARERNALGICLLCENPANGSRGLCSPDYLKFWRKKEKLPPEEAARLDAEMVEHGHLLPDRQAKRPGRAVRKIDEVMASIIAKTGPAAIKPADKLAELEAAIDDDEKLIQEMIFRLQVRLENIQSHHKAPAKSRRAR